MEQIREETEEDSDHGVVHYNPRRHEQKRNIFKNSKVVPMEPNATSVTHTLMGDVTAADDMVMGDDSMLGDESMLRPPGPPIGYANMYSASASPLYRSPDVSGRSASKLISDSSAADKDEERVNDRNYTLNVFNVGIR